MLSIFFLSAAMGAFGITLQEFVYDIPLDSF